MPVDGVGSYYDWCLDHYLVQALVVQNCFEMSDGDPTVTATHLAYYSCDASWLYHSGQGQLKPTSC